MLEGLLFERNRRLRDALQALPAELAPLCAALPSGEIRPFLDLLEREMRRFLERMSAELSSDVRAAVPALKDKAS